MCKNESFRYRFRFFQEDVAHFVSDYGDRLEAEYTFVWEKERVVM